MRDRRRFLRRNRTTNGFIRFIGPNGPEVVACVVKDLSSSGARLLFVTGPEIPAEFRLSVEGIAEQACIVRWRAASALGIEFVAPPDIQPNSPSIDDNMMPEQS